MLSPAVDNLVAQLTRLPGIGTRTAQRLTFHLLSVSPEEALALAEAIGEMKERVHFCRDCGNLTEEELCVICTDPRRDRSIVCVVEQPVDVVSLERTHEFRGLHFASFADPLYDTFAFIARSDAPLSPAARAFVEIVERRLERVAEAALYAAGTSESDG